MKKATILLTLVMVIGITLAAWAGATKYTLTQGEEKKGYPPQTARSGFAIVNDDTEEPQTVIQFQVRGMDMAPHTEYYAYYYQEGYHLLGELKMNKKGSGHLHANVEGGIPGGYWLGVSDTYPDIGTTNQFLFVWVPVPVPVP